MSDQELAAVARLREDVYSKPVRAEFDHVVVVRTADVRAVLTALEAAQADARRYRWLRDKARREGREGGWTGFYTFPVVHAWNDTPYAVARHEAFRHKTLDAAIDAAMKGENRG